MVAMRSAYRGRGTVGHEASERLTPVRMADSPIKGVLHAVNLMTGLMTTGTVTSPLR
jgi:hypothetical protein